MTEITYTLDEVHAALAHRLVEDMIQHQDDASRDEREPDVAPDADFADMAIDERNEALDDYRFEEEAAMAHAEYLRDNRWNPYV